jgi:hypothetical protein
MRRALRRFTLHVRAAAAIGGGLLGAMLLVGFLLLPIHAGMTHAWTWQAGMALDIVILAMVMGLSWVGIGSSVRFQLRRHFPDLKISLHGHAGLIGVSMLAAIFCAWMAALLFAPNRPDWVSHILALIHH